ncbi:hypothetical protein RRG08_031331 [Elysia crispata]|uniref:Uncharacterized protein n=1 Tax=Elysia crispata TaxID=231223 RepID=A0AAE1CZ87_9GAST|nr:hypothetical protein RRG08_031331 [Elysia crispata]
MKSRVEYPTQTATSRARFGTTLRTSPSHFLTRATVNDAKGESRPKATQYIGPTCMSRLLRCCIIRVLKTCLSHR